MVSDGLTQLDENGHVLPALSSSWETTDKGKTWIFTLKDGYFWQDGKKVTSQGINYQFSDVTVERPNDKTIIFKLQNAYSAFPSVVSKPTFKSGLLGTKEWKVSDISLNGSIVEQLTLTSKSGDKKVFKFYPTEDKTKLAFQLGKVDRIEGLLDATPFLTWKKVTVDKKVEAGEYVAVFFNTSDNFLSDKNIRQALSYAINKNVLGGERAISPVSVNSWAYNPQVKPYNYDLTKAKQMISEYKKNSKIDVLTVNLNTPPLLLPQAESISSDWRAAGIEVNLKVISTIPTDYQTFLAIYDIPVDPDQYSIWHSTQTTTNITHYQDPRIDKLLEDGRSQIIVEDRKKTYFDFQRFLVEDAPAAFLYYPDIYSISR
jgi:peptide/nickel transport system substrate-binding protein